MNKNGEKKMKYFPNVGDELYLRQFTDNYMVNMVKRPYTVIEVTPKIVKVQSCELIYPVFRYEPSMREYYREFDGKRVCFYDTVAESIKPDPNGRIIELSWHSHRGMWGEAGKRECEYPMYAVFGKYEHQPYLD